MANQVSVIVQNLSQKGQFVDDFLRFAIDERGFGSLVKGDYETLLLHLLCKYNPGFAQKSDFEKSLILQIPETKVSRLIYEGKIKYGATSEEEMRTSIREYLRGREFHVTKDMVNFTIEDKFMRNYMAFMLKKDKLFFDKSFNSEVISVPHEKFLGFMQKYFYTQEELKCIEKECTKRQKDPQKFWESYFSNLLASGTIEVLTVGVKALLNAI